MAAVNFSQLPYLTRDLSGIGGKIKESVEDFCVEEIPLYQASGEGTHVFFRVLKSGIPTPAAVDRIARYMGVKPQEIGVAGLKDAQAVTSQYMSLEHVEPEKLLSFPDKQIKIDWTSRHTNKLRPGHLAANRFSIKIRGVGQDKLPAAQEILDILSRRGVPNFFGSQRFGARGDTGLLGAALVKGDLEEFISIFLGQPQPNDPPDCKAARDAFDAGYFERALGHWPRHYYNERKSLSAYKRRKNPKQAFAVIDKRMKRFYVSAFQSAIFNEVLAQRIDGIDKVLIGDMAQKTDSGGAFTVEDVQVEQPRADRFEISPTGPLPGFRSDLATGQPGKIEREVLAANGVEQKDFRRVGPLKVKGTRRALRFKIDESNITAGSDERGEYLEIKFTAPSGCYATVALREIMKSG